MHYDLATEYHTQAHSATSQSMSVSPSINLSPTTPEVRVALGSHFGAGRGSEASKGLPNTRPGMMMETG